jgi:hypothetical protein
LNAIGIVERAKVERKSTGNGEEWLELLDNGENGGV